MTSIERTAYPRLKRRPSAQKLEDRTGDYLPAAVNLTFAEDKWLRTVLVRTDKGTRLARRHFEVCVFAALAAALKAGAHAARLVGQLPTEDGRVVLVAGLQ